MDNEVAVTRYVRPFVSSPFLDLKEERDALVNLAFPRIRKYCEARGVTWSAVDLRWGVNSEDRILPVCLDEVARSRPFFIGVLGDRYGTTPESIPAYLKVRYPWLERYPGRSITELEIIFGALEESRDPVIPFFYFRDKPGNASEGEPAEGNRNSDDATRLSSLKKRIRQRYGDSVRAGFRTAEQLAEWVEEDLKRKIDELYPLGGAPSANAQQELDQRAFALSRRRVYVPDPAMLLHLEVHAASTETRPLVIVGESGSGKSALLANWSASHAERHKDDLVVTHFVGGGEEGGRLDVVLRQLIAALRDAAGNVDGADADQPTAAMFARALSEAARHRRVILVIDALDQLEDSGGARDVAWLPKDLPPKARVFLSTTPGRPADAADERKWHVEDMPLLRPSQVPELTRRYLDAHGKKEGLVEGQLAMIAEASQATNPLFLCTVLDELVPLGNREAVDAALTDLLHAADVSALFEKVLTRYARDHQMDRPGLIRDALSLVWASRRGLSEAELLDLLGADGEPLPAALWSSFALRADRIFLSRSGLLTFSHPHVRAAVERKFVSTDGERCDAHRRLAAYFRGRRTDPAADQAYAMEASDGRLLRKRMPAAQFPIDRCTEEYPWQLERAAQWAELARWLATLPDALLAFLKARPDVLHYWAAVESRSGARAVDLLRPVLDAPDRHRQAVPLVISVLTVLGHTKELEGFAARVVDTLADGSDEFASALFTHVHALVGAGDFDRAEAVCVRAKADFAQAGKEARHAETLRMLSDVAIQRGDLDRALELEQEAASLLQRLGADEEANRTFRVQARIHAARGDREAARECWSHAAQVARDERDLLGLAASLSELGALLGEANLSEEAEKAYQEAENVLLALGEPDLLGTFYFHRGVAEQNLHGWYTAEPWYDKSETYAQRIGDAKLLARIRVNRATGLSPTDPDRALAYVEDAVAYFRSAGTGDGESLAAAVNLKATVLTGMGRDADAEALHVESLGMARRPGRTEALIRCLCNYALFLLSHHRDLEKALALLEEARLLLETVPDRELLAAVTRVAQVAADRLGGLMMAADLDGTPEAEVFAERLRRWEETWKLSTAGVQFVAREAVAAVRAGEHRKALTLLENAASRLVRNRDDEDGHAVLRQTLIYLVDQVNPKADNPIEAMAEAATILEPKTKILRALGAKDELVRAYLSGAVFLTLSFDLYPLGLSAEPGAALVGQGHELPHDLEGDSLAIGCIQRAIHAVDEASRLAKLYQPREEMFADPRKEPRQHADVLRVYALIIDAIGRRAAQLEQRGAAADACRLWFLRAGVARLTQDAATLSATLAELAFKLAAIGEPAMARDTAADAASLARTVGDAILAERLTPLLEHVPAPPATDTGPTSPRIEPEVALDPEDREWVAGLDRMFIHLDDRIPGLTYGSPAEDARALFTPYLTADLDVLKQALRTFVPSALMVGIADVSCVGFVRCPRCGHYAAPQGRQAGIGSVTCGTCQRHLESPMIEYSPRVGRAIAALAAEHANATALVKRAGVLRDSGDHGQAAELARRAATVFRRRGLPLAEAGALLEAARALEAAGDPAAARGALIEGLQLVFGMKRASVLTRALLEIANHHVRTRSATATAVLGLLIDIASAHDPELETNADAANARFLQALIASSSVNTLEQARQKYDEAFAFLSDAVAQPGGRQLLGRGFDRRFALLQERMTADYPSLVKVANETRVALDADATEAAQQSGTDLLKRLAEFGDKRSILVLANRLVLVNVQRENLRQALECLRIQAAFADQPGDAPIRANALRNQSVLEQAIDPEAAPATLTEAEAVERIVDTARRDLATGKLKATEAMGRSDVLAAAEAWAEVARGAEIVGDTAERLQALMRGMSLQMSSDRPVPTLLTALDAEALSLSTPAVAQALAVQAQALMVLGESDAAALRMARAAPAWQACLKLAADQPTEVREQLEQMRDHALLTARQAGDARARLADWPGAERFYRASSAAAAACVALDSTDFKVRFRHVADLDELGNVILKQGEERIAEGKTLCREALKWLDQLDAEDPGGLGQRSASRLAIVSHIG